MEHTNCTGCRKTRKNQRKICQRFSFYDHKVNMNGLSRNCERKEGRDACNCTLESSPRELKRKMHMQCEFQRRRNVNELQYNISKNMALIIQRAIGYALLNIHLFSAVYLALPPAFLAALSPLCRVAKVSLHTLQLKWSSVFAANASIAKVFAHT